MTEPTREQVQEWTIQIEKWLRDTLGDIITPEGSDIFVRYRYIPNSLKDVEPLYYETLEGETYLESVIASYDAEISEITDPIQIRFSRQIARGVVEIPLGEYWNLILDEVDAIEGIFNTAVEEVA